MLDLVHLEKVDYLVVGHIANDITPAGTRLGGTAAYAALTARLLGLKVGIVTSMRSETDLQPLSGIHVLSVDSPHTTTFENITQAGVRRQILHHRAEPILLEHIPDVWRAAPIMHLAPIAGELSPNLSAGLSASLLGITPQGWMRSWDKAGKVRVAAWEHARQSLQNAGAVVLSLDDAGGDLELVESLAHQTRTLCLTEGAAGAVVYWHGDRRRFHAPETVELDATGAGDIFAAAFFTRLYATRDPWEAARFATQLAARSVTRPGLEGIPTAAEVEDCLMEVIS
jgi:sugar/nucleoside kinase (ribokinase family)